MFSIVLVYMLIVVNFQSWLDPFIIITALRAALCEIILFLFVTHTTLSVPALTGAIMCVGVATANSILVISFAKERLTHHGDPALAAVGSGFTRFRPAVERHPSRQRRPHSGSGPARKHAGICRFTDLCAHQRIT